MDGNASPGCCANQNFVECSQRQAWSQSDLQVSGIVDCKMKSACKFEYGRLVMTIVYFEPRRSKVPQRICYLLL